MTNVLDLSELGNGKVLLDLDGSQVILSEVDAISLSRQLNSFFALRFRDVKEAVENKQDPQTS